jgi:hypothetical protein
MSTQTEVNACHTITIDEAAARLGVEPPAVRLFLRQHLLRSGDATSSVLEADVERLHRVLLRCQGQIR